MKRTTLLLALLLILVISCKKDDDPIICPEGFTGSDCNVQLTPKSIVITKIKVTKMPATDANGAGWDLTSGPDIYYQIKNGQTIVADGLSTWVQNATVGTSWNTQIELADADATFSFGLFDYDDFDPNDFMGAINQNVYFSTNHFPPVIPVQCSGCTVGFELTVLYIF